MEPRRRPAGHHRPQPQLEHTYIDGHQGLGFNRFDGTPAPFPAGAKLFEFVGWEQANR
jgi:hypothetical protein